MQPQETLGCSIVIFSLLLTSPYTTMLCCEHVLLSCLFITSPMMSILQFIDSAKEICARLTGAGYWADFIDPASGRAVSSEMVNCSGKWPS